MQSTKKQKANQADHDVRSSPPAPSHPTPSLAQRVRAMQPARSTVGLEESEPEALRRRREAEEGCRGEEAGRRCFRWRRRQEEEAPHPVVGAPSAASGPDGPEEGPAHANQGRAAEGVDICRNEQGNSRWHPKISFVPDGRSLPDDNHGRDDSGQAQHMGH